jgi:hypothetical protein
MPVATKAPLERIDTLNEYGSIQGASESTANKCCRGVERNDNGSMHCRNFSDRYALVV